MESPCASQPTQLKFSSANTDGDTFTYDPVGRMQSYTYTVNSQSVTGNLTWNANGTLAQLITADPFNSANTQNCSYSHDDLVRIASVNCGASTWQQNFSYDPFGNITKTVPTGGTGTSFQPTYSATTNRIASIGSFTPTYDLNGDVTNDGIHTYAWDAFGNATTIDGVGITFDALDRMVEQNRSGTYTQFIYSPTGFKMQIMNGATTLTNFVPLPGGASIVYIASGYYFRHADWLGSSRFSSTSARAMYSDKAYAPFGEPYAQSGTTDLSFTGMNSDTSSGLYDFLFREYSTQGRWVQPDPAGLAAADFSNPQSWNRYAYVLNSPLANVDPLGLVCNGVNNFMWDSLANGTGIFTPEDCAANGGTWSGAPPQYGSSSSGCRLDGAQLPCNLPVFSSSGGATASCPNNNCTGVIARMGPGGSTVYQQWVPPTLTQMTNPNDPIRESTGYWNTISTSDSTSSNDSWFTNAASSAWSFVAGPSNDPRPSCVGHFFKNTGLNFFGFSDFNAGGVATTTYLIYAPMKALPRTLAGRGFLTSRGWLAASTAARGKEAGAVGLLVNLIIAEGQALGTEYSEATSGACK